MYDDLENDFIFMKATGFAKHDLACSYLTKANELYILTSVEGSMYN